MPLPVGYKAKIWLAHFERLLTNTAIFSCKCAWVSGDSIISALR